MHFQLPALKDTDWGDLFDALLQCKLKNKTIVMFDEISWMGMEDPTFLPKLKNLWDDGLSDQSNLVFIICSSVSSWIEENVLSSTGFVGRISHTIELQELPLSICNQFFQQPGCRVSAYERFQILSVTGGIPLYLENVEPKQSAQHNIKRLCYSKGGLLTKEFKQIFSDLFSNKSPLYQQIVEQLVYGPLDNLSLCKKIKASPSQATSDAFNHLVKAGFIKRDFTWDIKNGKFGKLSVYRLSDNYVRFYLKYIEPALPQIEQGFSASEDLQTFKQINTILGLQFENLVNNNIPFIADKIGINLSDILICGPYFQTKTNRRVGCQIDLLIQTQQQTLFIVEIKFSKNPISPSIIKEMEQKINALDYPKGFSIRPILIHVNGVTEALEDEHYFAEIIDLTDALN